MRTRHHVKIAAHLVGITLFAAGCVTVAAKADPRATRLPEDVRRARPAIRIVISETTGVRVTKAARGALGGMGRGAGIGAVAVTLGDPRGIIASPIGALVGAVVGAFAADPRAKVEEDEAALRTLVGEARVSARLNEAIARLVRERTGAMIVDADDERDVVILEISVAEIALAGMWEINPHLTLVIPVETAVRRAAAGVQEGGRAGATLGHHAVTWRGVQRSRKAWLADAGRALDDEVTRAVEALAERIVDDLFLVVATPGTSR